MIDWLFQDVDGWTSLDTWIVVTAALAAMACAVPGAFLLVRRQSMLGDALSHTALPGIALGFLTAIWLRESGWIGDEVYVAWRHGAVVAGAILVSILTAVLTETVQKAGQVEGNAALGVVFTSLFAVGLLLVRMVADKVDLDPDCVLYGTIETTVLDRIGPWNIPRAAIANLVVLIVNLVLVVLFFKELRIAAFDPALATSMGIHAQVVHYALTCVTAVTLVTAFESVGSILVIAMLVAPAATAHLLTDRLSRLIGCAVGLAALSAALGHVLAITLPGWLFTSLGFEGSITASTAGMMAVASGLLFVGAMLFGPKYGLVTRAGHRLRLSVQVAAEDILGTLYRRQEQGAQQPLIWQVAPGSLRQRLALRWLLWRNYLAAVPEGISLTARGRRRAEELVRSHRLWESYMAKHLPLPEDHLHATAERVEHFIDSHMRADIAAELAAPAQDPHGRSIPAESD